VGASGSVRGRGGQNFAGGGGGYSLEAAMRRVPYRLQEEVERYLELDPLTWTLQGEGGYELRAARLLHRVPCGGYVVTEPGGKAQVDKEAARALGLSKEDVLALARGEREVRGADGRAVARGDVITPAAPGRKVVVLGDTHCSEHIAPLARGCDVLVHEATFTDGQEGKAAQAGHSTARMAGRFSQAIGCKNLVLTHFSPRFNTFNTADGKSQDAGGDATDISYLKKQAAEETTSNVFAASDFFTFKVPPARSAAT